MITGPWFLAPNLIDWYNRPLSQAQTADCVAHERDEGKKFAKTLPCLPVTWLGSDIWSNVFQFFISSAKPWASRSLNVIRTQVLKELHLRNALCVFEIAKNNWKRQSPPLRGHKMPPRRKMCDPNVVKSQIFSNVDQLRVQGRRFQI